MAFEKLFAIISETRIRQNLDWTTASSDRVEDQIGEWLNLVFYPNKPR